MTSGMAAGLRLAGILDFGTPDDFTVSQSYFVVPLSITFATPDAPASSATGSSRITLVDGLSASSSVEAIARITTVG